MRWAAAVIALAAAGLAACGGNGDDTARTVTVETGAGGAVRVVGDEYSFDPKGIVIAAGGGGGPVGLKLTLDNRGALAHNLRVLDGDRDQGGTPTFQGGETRSGEVELAPGRYRMVCTVGDHEELGMVGTLEVSAR
jgi:plastocyanin